MSEVAFLAISALIAGSVYYRRIRNTTINDLIIKLQETTKIVER